MFSFSPIALAVSVSMSTIVTAIAPSITQRAAATKGPSYNVHITFPFRVKTSGLMGSMISNDLLSKTLVLGCLETTDCGPYPPPLTITGGVSTFALTAADLDDRPSITLDCKYSAEGGYCAYNNGAGGMSSSTSLAYTDLMDVDVTITADREDSPSSSTSTSSSSPAQSTPPLSSSPNDPAQITSTSGASASGIENTASNSTSTPNDAKILIPGAFAAALMGFAAVYL